MDDKKVDILLSKADLFKVASLGSGGVFLWEMVKTEPDHTIVFGSLVLTAIFVIVLMVLWDKAQRLTNRKN